MTTTTRHNVWETIRTLVVAGLLAVLVRTFLYSPFHIPSGSMISTLLIGDYLFVSKFPYGLSKYSFPFSPPIFSGRLFGRMPNVGDVVVFRSPTRPDEDWIKRVIGLPGDRIQMIDGVLHINGHPVTLERIENYTWRTEKGEEFTSPQFIETLPNGVKHRIIKDAPFGQGTLDNTREFVVPENNIFVMGDNRDHSDDSRNYVRVGCIPFENILGRAELIFFSTALPTEIGGGWWQIWKWPTATRYTRFFTVIR